MQIKLCLEYITKIKELRNIIFFDFDYYAPAAVYVDGIRKMHSGNKNYEIKIVSDDHKEVKDYKVLFVKKFNDDGYNETRVYSF